MSGAPEPSDVRATKEDGVLAEAARTARSQETAPDGGAILRTDKATIRFGGLVAVNTLDMDVRPGEIYGLIGPNGAGKTTVFNLLTGVYKPTSGEIYFQGQRVDGLRPYQIARRGVSRTFQNIRLFPGMSVLENVMTACHRHARWTPCCARRATAATSASTATSAWSCWRFSTSRASRTRAGLHCLTATSGGLRSCARWRRARSSCS
jgi:ABC-type branched-subunit amino acid transport system ATPase component